MDRSKNLDPCRDTKTAQERGAKGGRMKGVRTRERKFLTAVIIDALDAGELDDAAAAMVAEKLGISPKRVKRIHTVVNAILSKAEMGDVAAFNAIADRVEGKPTQELNATVTGDKPTISFSSDEDGEGNVQQ